MNSYTTLYMIMIFYVILSLIILPLIYYYIIKPTTIFSIEKAIIIGFVISIVLYYSVGRQMVLDAE